MKRLRVESCITHMKMNYDILKLNYYSTPLIFKLLFISIWMLALSEVRCSWSSSARRGVMTQNRNVLVGTKLEINCTIFNTTIEINKKSYEVNSSMIWFKFKNRYYSEDKIHLINKTVAQLSVENATLEDKGVYKCLLNVSGLNLLVGGGLVTVGYKPQNVTDFKCISFYNRKLLCEWTPLNNSIDTTYHLIDRINVSISPNEFDCQSCKCGNNPTENSCEWRTDTVPPFRKTAQKFNLLLTGENEFGKNQQLFTIEHNTIIKPNKPNNLTHSFLKKNNLNISWSAPKNEADDEHIFEHIIYEIHYFRIDSHNPNNANIKPVIIEGIRETNITLTHLIPFNRYNVSIRCKTDKSINKDEYWSDFSSIEVKTKPDVPYFAPVLILESFEAVETFEGNRSITLYWKSIPIENHNAIGFHYYIKYRQMSGEKYEADNDVYDHKVIVKSEYTNHTFKLMDLNTAYNFKIYGVNDEGMSKNFSEITIYENDYMPYKPTNINVFSYGKGRYELQWEKLKDNPNSSLVVKYTVFWCQIPSQRSFPCEGAINWTQTTNTSIDLELPDIISNYKFAVSANALNSSSGITWAECMVPFEGRLDKLSEVRLEVLSLTSINVKWKLNCPAQERVVKGYKIHYCKVEDILDRDICYEPHSKSVNKSENFTLNGLNPNFKYKISVVALTSLGQSEESDPKYVFTIQDLPEHDPFVLEHVQITSNSIELHWKPPFIPNVKISKYSIFCNQKLFIFNASDCSNNCSFEMNGLSSYDSYEMNVSVYACDSELFCSVYINHTFSMRTLASIPGQMDPPRTDFPNATVVRISWSPPVLPNGPIDYYLLKQIWRNDKTESIVAIPSDQKEYYLSLDCNSHGGQSAVSIVAVNKVKNEDLFGNYSLSTDFIACHRNEFYIIGITGGIISFMTIVIILYMLMRWIKRKINAYKNFVIELPKGLEQPLWRLHSKSFLELDHTLEPNYILLVMTDEQYFENIDCSEISHESSSSNDGLNYMNLNQSNNSFPQILSTDSGQHESVSLAFYNGEPQSFDLGLEIDIQSNPKDNNDLKRVNKSASALPPLGKISPQNSDSSITKNSDLDMNPDGNSKRKSNRSISISTDLPTITRNEALNHMHFCPINHKTSNDSKLANSEPSFYNLLEEENLTQIYKPDITKCLSHIIENSCNSAPQIKFIFCDSKVSSMSSNNDNERTDIITQLNSSDVSTHFSECEKIQNKSLNEFKDNGQQNEINSSVNPSIISIKKMFSNLNAVEVIPALNETKSLSTSSLESIESKKSPNHLSIDSNGYVLHNVLTN